MTTTSSSTTNSNTTSTPTAAAPVTRMRGSCHCGAVHYAVELDWSSGASRCNCTICTKLAYLGKSVKPAAFTLLDGADALSSYEWASKMSKRFFCKHCGTHVYGAGHLRELGGDFVSINCNTLDDVELKDLAVAYWDGRHNNWYAGTRQEPWAILAKSGTSL
ncbi:MAG TPA: GFA family protein [Myxococcota bacterium]|jgi:hypothetical protein